MHRRRRDALRFDQIAQIKLLIYNYRRSRNTMIIQKEQDKIYPALFVSVDFYLINPKPTSMVTSFCSDNSFSHSGKKLYSAGIIPKLLATEATFAR